MKEHKKSNVLKILLVENDLNQRQLMQEIYQAHGHQTCLARDGAEALALLQSGSFDVLVSDVMMPIMNGIELCKEVGQALPVVLVTGAQASDFQGNLLGNFCDCYLEKIDLNRDLYRATIKAIERFKLKINAVHDVLAS